MRLLDLISECTNRLTLAKVSFGHGTTNAHDEASWLVLWSLGLPLDTDTTLIHSELSENQIHKAYKTIDSRIKERKPSAYLTGEAWLQGVPFFVDQRSIIPRSLIAECLVDGSIDPWLSIHTSQVLDLCTGNGSLAILCAMVFPDVKIDALDISVEALEVAQINLKRHLLEQRIKLVLSDCMEHAGGPYDLILCNPPYVNSKSMSELPEEFKAEPHLSLYGGEDGMDFIRRFLTDTPNYLCDTGVIVLEIGHERNNFEIAFPHLDCVWLQTSAAEDQVVLITRHQLTAFLQTQ